MQDVEAARDAVNAVQQTIIDMMPNSTYAEHHQYLGIPQGTIQRLISRDTALNGKHLDTMLTTLRRWHGEPEHGNAGITTLTAPVDHATKRARRAARLHDAKTPSRSIPITSNQPQSARHVSMSTVLLRSVRECSPHRQRRLRDAP